MRVLKYIGLGGLGPLNGKHSEMIANLTCPAFGSFECLEGGNFLLGQASLAFLGLVPV